MRIPTITAALAVALAISAGAQVTKQSVEGVNNFARVGTTVACGGPVTREGVAEIKKMGFNSIINLMTATESGADVEGEAAAAKQAGINYVHVPFDLQSPAPNLVPDFLKAVTTPQNEPAYIHCSSGARSAALWMIKRVEVDGWDEARALDEAEALGLSMRTKPFALNYIHSHPKQP